MPRAGLSTAAVVAAAAEIADSEGLDRLTLARIAATAGVRTPSLYNHVSSATKPCRALRTARAAWIASSPSRP